jgi:hypothetical protein
MFATTREDERTREAPYIATEKASWKKGRIFLFESGVTH